MNILKTIVDYAYRSLILAINGFIVVAFAQSLFNAFNSHVSYSFLFGLFCYMLLGIIGFVSLWIHKQLVDEDN